MKQDSDLIFGNHKKESRLDQWREGVASQIFCKKYCQMRVQQVRKLSAFERTTFPSPMKKEVMHFSETSRRENLGCCSDLKIFPLIEEGV